MSDELQRCQRDRFFLDNMRLCLGLSPLYGQPSPAGPLHEFVEFGSWHDPSYLAMPAGQRRLLKRQGDRTLGAKRP